MIKNIPNFEYINQYFLNPLIENKFSDILYMNMFVIAQDQIFKSSTITEM